MAAPTPMGVPALKDSLRSELLVPGLRKVFMLEAKKFQSVIPILYNISSSTRKFEEMVSMTGISGFEIKDETGPITYQSLGNGYKSRWTHVTYANGVSHSLEAVEDEQYGILKKGAQLLARSAQRTRERHALSFFNNGFTTVWNTEEGQYFFDSDHPLDPRAVHTTTFSNLIEADFDLAPLEEAIRMLLMMPDAQGEAMGLVANTLLIGSTLVNKAKRVLQSDGDYFSPNKTINPIRNALKIVTSPYITGNNWFVGAAKEETELHWINRRPLRDAAEEDFDTEVVKHKATMRYSWGAADPRGWIGGKASS